MPSDLQTGAETQQSVTSLVSGIVSDAQELLKQQLQLFKAEVQSDLKKTREAMISLVTGAAVAGVGGLMLCWGLAYLCNWAFDWPTWGGFFLVGGVIAVLGGILVYVGLERFRSFNPLPEQTAEALRENLEWKTKPR